VKRGLDTNVLVYAHVASLPEHGVVRGFLEGQLTRRDVTLVLTPAVLHEFVHVVTDPRRFEPPVAIGEALALARLYLGRANVECLATDAEAVAAAFGLVDRHQLGCKRLADTLLAATLLRHGVRQLVTCNRADFEVFSGLDLIDPRGAANASAGEMGS
jgi:toxin-antitoxin system PIN domain toxin